MASNDLVGLVREGLAAAADPEKAGPMAAYLKTDMPFYGVQKAGRTPVVREAIRTFPPANQAEYELGVRSLWSLPHREEKYVALGYARGFPTYVSMASMTLYRDLVVDGAWWDLVDETATKLVGAVLAKERPSATPLINHWVPAPDLWLRRTAIICQIGHKTETDTDLLERACVENVGDNDFFIRKAIGWALREYAKTDPSFVIGFVRTNEDGMSALSRREACKHLGL